MGRPYGQYCALARALDVVGDRWTLLIVRELLVGEATYGRLLEGLPGIATNLLVERLRSLEATGVVERSGTGKATRYRLSDRGRQLREAVHALVRWGAPDMTRGTGADAFRPGWLVLALGALASPIGEQGTIAFAVRGEVAVLEVSSGQARLAREGESADVIVESDPETALAVASGLLPLRQAVAEGKAVVSGGLRRAERLLAATAAGSPSARGEKVRRSPHRPTPTARPTT
jgi:DNA-binding HxlR family transcriptional regulator